MGAGNITCDGCRLDAGQSRKPNHWFSRTDKDTGREWFACSRKCIDTIAERTGDTRVILPF